MRLSGHPGRGRDYDANKHCIPQHPALPHHWTEEKCEESQSMYGGGAAAGKYRSVEQSLELLSFDINTIGMLLLCLGYRVRKGKERYGKVRKDMER